MVTLTSTGQIDFFVQKVEGHNERRINKKIITINNNKSLHLKLK